MNASVPHPWIKTPLHLSLLALLLLAAPIPCLALRSIGIITPKEAKDMGIEVRATPAGPDALWLELEFKPDGKLKSYSHVELEIGEGEKSLISYAKLAEQKTNTGSILVRFIANRAYLEKVTLVIVTGFPSNYSGNELHLKDFVDLAKLR